VLNDRSVQLLDVDAAGQLLADPRGELRGVAASTEASRLIELFQIQDDQGPCLDCYRSGQPGSAPGHRAGALAPSVQANQQFIRSALVRHTRHVAGLQVALEDLRRLHLVKQHAPNNGLLDHDGRPAACGHAGIRSTIGLVMRRSTHLPVWLPDRQAVPTRRRCPAPTVIRCRSSSSE